LKETLEKQGNTMDVEDNPEKQEPRNEDDSESDLSSSVTTSKEEN
jgi:hypothetical protein